MLVMELERDEMKLNNVACEIQSIAYHTNQVTPGSCFVAIRGMKTDGHRYINEAVARGAVAVVMEHDMPLPETVTKILVEDARDTLARLSARFFEEPSKQLTLVGITGTNGKTTIAYLLESILVAARLRCGVISTVDARYPSSESVVTTLPATHTTPESYVLQKLLREMVDHHVSHGVMEVTSHAIDLKRVVDCHFDGAIFTNLTPDHLDYHANLEQYYSCKEKLFTERLAVSEKPAVWSVVNWDDPYGRRLAQAIRTGPVLRTSLTEPVEIFTSSLQADWHGLQLTVETPRGSLNLHSPLLGRFNASNILSAVGAALAMKLPMEAIASGIASCRGAPGRLEEVPNTRNLKVLVDFAHTPNALENVLTTLKPLIPGKLITVFGCGGDRDRGKRPMMGKIAADLSDQVIVTSDNPRSESPQTIMDEIVTGMTPTGKKNFQMIIDRREAIRTALAMAKQNDCVLIAGKGHERFQIIGEEKKSFDDHKIAGELLNGI